MTEIRLLAEKKFASELAALKAADKAAKPDGWQLSPRAVETHILGSGAAVNGVSISPKFIGDRFLVQVMIATLISTAP